MVFVARFSVPILHPPRHSVRYIFLCYKWRAGDQCWGIRKNVNIFHSNKKKLLNNFLCSRSEDNDLNLLKKDLCLKFFKMPKVSGHLYCRRLHVSFHTSTLLFEGPKLQYFFYYCAKTARYSERRLNVILTQEA